jgi:hypothetical protein
MKKDTKKAKRVVRAIHFDENTYKALQQAAEIEGVGFATYLKSAALNFTKSFYEHAQILEAVSPNDPAAGQKMFQEAFKDLREVFSRTFVKSSERTEKRLDRLEKLMRRMIYVQLYYNREIPADGKAAAQIAAKSRMEILLKDIDAASLE